jgi:ABC-type glycerol-3-phosphate transport system substrate-binding protein
MEEDRLLWSVPVNAYVYAIAYRRDLLAQAGLDGATAFAIPSAVEETVCKLEELDCTQKAWLMPYGRFPYSMDMIHNAASWIWSSGGKLVDNRGKQVLFDSPATLAGLRAFLKLLRRQPEIDSLFWAHDTLQRLIEGKAAAVLTDTRGILTYLQEDTPQTRNIGTASVMSIPYGGGGNLVIWKHTYAHSDRLEAACKLVEFLTRKSTMLEVGRRSHILPARVDALDELIPADHPLQPVIAQLVSSSRTYRTIPLWRRIESQFGQELSMIAEAVLDDKNLDLDAILSKTMSRLTQRLNLLLQ